MSEEQSLETSEPTTATEPTPPAPRGIKETQEVLKALDVLADFLSQILADGRVNGSDLLLTVELLKKIEVFSEAVKGAKEIDDELKDLDESELVSLGLQACKLVIKVVKAVKQVKAE